MAISNETITFIQNTQIADHDYNSKIIFLIVVFGYLWLSIYFSNKVCPFKTKFGEIELYKWFLGFLMRYPAIVLIVLYPLFMIFLISGYEFQTMLSYVIIVYTILISLSIPLAFVFGGEYIVTWINKLLNTNFSFARFKK